MNNQDSPTVDKFAANLRAIAADEDCPTVLEPFAIEAADRIESLTRELAQIKRELEQSRAGCLLMKNAAQELNRELVEAKERLDRLPTICELAGTETHSLDPGVVCIVCWNNLARELAQANGRIAELEKFENMYKQATRVLGDAEVLAYVTSGNSIPVTRCTVSADLIRQLLNQRVANSIEAEAPCEHPWCWIVFSDDGWSKCSRCKTNLLGPSSRVYADP